MGSNAQIRHPFFARGYQRMRVRVDAKGGAAHRAELVAGLSGTVVEVGAGDGANFAHYPTTVTEVVAVEPEPLLRAQAEQAARGAPVKVRVVDGTAESLPVPEGSQDAAVLSLVMCSVRDPQRVVAELHRVLRDGGEVRFYEHVLSDDPRYAKWQHRGAPIQAWVAGGCHPDRDTTRTLEQGGFPIERERRFAFRPMPLAVLSAPHTIGVARKR